jgi:hypothetical protein
MAEIKVELNLPGINQVMKSNEIGQSVSRAASYVQRVAERMSGKAYSKSRFRRINWLGVASIYPADTEAAENELQTNTLLKAIGHAGLPTRKGG